MPNDNLAPSTIPVAAIESVLRELLELAQRADREADRPSLSAYMKAVTLIQEKCHAK